MKKSSTARLSVEGSGNAANLRYASGFVPVDPVVFLDAGGAGRHLVVPMLEYGRAQQEASKVMVWTPIALEIPAEKRRSTSAWAVAVVRKAGIRSVQVEPTFPLAVALALKKAGVRVKVAEKGLYPERAVKSARELACITEAQQAAVAALRAALSAIREAKVNRAGELVLGGKVLSSERLKLVIDHTLLEQRCMARDTIAACGRHAADPHHRGEGPLRAGETIVIDIFPQHQKTGYWGDITRTVVKGRASPVARKMFRAVRAAQAWARGALRPGIRADRIHAEIQRKFEADGFKTETRGGMPVGFFHGTGHGVGLEIHEAPSISTVNIRLRAGNVVTVEPGLYDPEYGGIRIEDTVVITRTGARVLVPFPYLFEVP